VLSVRRLSKPFASGLFANAEHGPDLRPGPTVCARFGDLIGEPKVAGSDVAMELGTQGHGVDHDGLLLWVIVEDHDLEGPAGAVRANYENSFGRLGRLVPGV
jgi:hypothetical protein